MNWLTRLAMWWIIRQMRRSSIGTNSWAWSWHCNIAVCAQDEGLEYQASQRAASRFMRLLFGFDTWPIREEKK